MNQRDCESIQTETIFSRIHCNPSMLKAIRNNHVAQIFGQCYATVCKYIYFELVNDFIDVPNNACNWFKYESKDKHRKIYCELY